uniref:Lipocalin/cytosolic fatty-acid binding domain-containing protein n=1 Tax=Amblyomma maculatum TaxID=34609 RepID=G3MT33_AMBMU
MTTVCFTAQEPSEIWKNQQKFSQYQMAWTIMNRSQHDVYFQVATTSPVKEIIYPTFYNPELTEFKCWSVRYSKQDQQKETALRKFKYALTSARRRNQVYYLYEEVKAIPTLGYSIKNGIEYIYTGERKETDHVMFTDGNTCDLYNVPRTNNGKGCELWVKSSYKENVPPAVHSFLTCCVEPLGATMFMTNLSVVKW